MSKQPSTQTRKQQCDTIHNNHYDYSLWPSNVSLSSIVPIICPVHGTFEQTLRGHLTNKQGCPFCSGRNKTLSKWIEEFNNHNNHKYDYSLIETINKNTDHIQILCSIHGVFERTVKTHMRGFGCPLCSGRITTKAENIKKANTIHNRKYDYSQLPSTFKNNDKVTILCPTHGPFNQKWNAHIHSKATCKKCRVDWVDPNTINLLLDKQWIYDQHIIQHKPLLQIANELNVGDTMVGRYLHNHDIDTVNMKRSIGEKELGEFIESIVDNVSFNDRTIINPLELDVVVPLHNIAFEYCGTFWHSEQNGKNKQYHHNKWKLCNEHGIQLITIFEDEWKHRKTQIKSKIKSLLNMDDRKVVYGRTTTISLVSTKDKKKFLDQNHIQGNGRSSVNIGLYHNTTLTACISLYKQGDDYVLNRYATSMRVIGGFSKLLKFFQLNFKFNKIISFADLRWSTGNLYNCTGWKLDSTLAPDYSYSLNGVDRIHKFNFRRAVLPNKLKSFNPNLSERENCNNNNVLRIWDCGKLKYILVQ